MTFKVGVTPVARDMIAKIKNPERKTILNKIRGLENDPEKQGCPLTGDLSEYRSLHVAGRYRAIYRVKRSEIEVLVIAVGIRKEGDKSDIYVLVKKLLDLV